MKKMNQNSKILEYSVFHCIFHSLVGLEYWSIGLITL